MRSRDEIAAGLRAALAAEVGLRWAYLFGSAARGERFRDVDVAVMPAEEACRSLTELGALAVRLSRALDRDVDVVDLRGAALPFAGPLLSERVLLLDREPQARREWEATTASRWLDFKPAWDESFAVRTEARRARHAGSR